MLRAELPPICLAECLRIAYERQPAIAAARASLAAREAAHAGIVNLKPPLQMLTAPDLPIRRIQACRGVSAAQADLWQAEYDAAYAVIRMYYTAVYAQQQFGLADRVYRTIDDARQAVDGVIKSGARNDKIDQDVLRRITVYTYLAENKRTEAAVGFDRALGGLREAMGSGLDCGCFRPADLELPGLSIVPCREQVIDLALQRRGELIQAIVAADVTRLEVNAQGKFCFKSLVRTFASSSDIHAKALPTAHRNGDYKPGAVGIEFPANLAGHKSYRMAQASAYADRTASVVDKTRGLVTLEAEDAVQVWREATDKVRASREAANAGDALALSSKENAKAAMASIKPDDAVKDYVLAGQARAALNEAIFEQILALANLERITAGGFCAGFLTPTAPAPAAILPDPTPKNGEPKKD
ncbi:MAG: hypothetical protein U0746_13510 [Gemmataceae bacterium]